MRHVAVISDIHSNIEAFDAVLDDIECRGIDELWCLGDVIGNGHAPTACFDQVEDRCAIVLAGNHEAAISSDRSDLPPAAAYSRAALHSAGGGRLSRLVGRASEIREDMTWLAHGCPSPFDPVRDYLGEDVDPYDVLATCSEVELIVVGHTHVVGEWSDEHRRLINVGSVGEPRGAVPLPTWTEIVWQPDGVSIRWCHVDFDLERYRANMLAAGLELPPMWEPSRQLRMSIPGRIQS